MPRTGTWSPYASWNCWSTGISSRHGPHQDAHRLTTIGPRRRGEVDVGATAEAGQRHRRAAHPRPVAASPGTHGSTPASAFCCRSSGVSTSIFAGARGGGRPARAAGEQQRRRQRGRRAAFMPALGLHQRGGGLGVGRALAVRRAPAGRPGRHRRRASWRGRRRRPCQIRWWLSIVQSRFGNSAPTRARP